MHAERLDAAERVERAVEVAHQRGFGDLEFEPVRCEAGFEQHLMHQLNEILAVDLHGGDVHGDGQRLRPARSLAAGFPQHPFADAENGTSLFRNRNEHGRRNRAAGFVIPAQQRFEADHIAGLDVALRLIDQIEFAAHDGLTQIVLQHPAVVDFCGHPGLEEAIGGSAFHLGAVERRVGMVQQRFAVVRVIRADRDADAARSHVVAVRLVAVGAQCFENRVGKFSDCGRIRQSGHQDCELVATKARDHAALVENGGDA